jgi:hypothetical protein
VRVISRDNTAQRLYDVAYSSGASPRWPIPASAAPVAEDPNEEIFARMATRAAELFGSKAGLPLSTSPLVDVLQLDRGGQCLNRGSGGQAS